MAANLTLEEEKKDGINPKEIKKIVEEISKIKIKEGNKGSNDCCQSSTESSEDSDSESNSESSDSSDKKN